MIKTYARRAGDRFCLLVTGHAEANAEGGRVCAAVSVLVTMLIHHARESEACRHVRAHRESGSCSLSCTGDFGEIFERVLKTLDALAVGHPTHMARVAYLSDQKREEIT